MGASARPWTGTQTVGARATAGGRSLAPLPRRRLPSSRMHAGASLTHHSVAGSLWAAEWSSRKSRVAPCPAPGYFSIAVSGGLYIGSLDAMVCSGALLGPARPVILLSRRSPGAPGALATCLLVLMAATGPRQVHCLRLPGVAGLLRALAPLDVGAKTARRLAAAPAAARRAAAADGPPTRGCVSSNFDPGCARLLAALQSVSYCPEAAALRSWACGARCRAAAGFEPSMVHYDLSYDLAGFAGYLPSLDAKVLVFRGTKASSWTNW